MYVFRRSKRSCFKCYVLTFSVDKHIIKKKEGTYMEDGKVILKRLMDGEKVVCPSCKKGFIEPVNESGKDLGIDELHYFKCTKCNFYIERIPPITIE